MRFEAIAGIGAVAVVLIVHGLDSARAAVVASAGVDGPMLVADQAPPVIRVEQAARSTPAPDPVRVEAYRSASARGARPEVPSASGRTTSTLDESTRVAVEREGTTEVTRIALQAGHWRADEAPRELAGLRGNGTAWEGIPEWETNLAIARSAGTMLEEMGYVVDILPAVVPPSYRADLFIAIHADGSNDSNASGYRVASPRRDATGRASRFASLLGDRYGEVTNLKRLPSVTRRMRNYYAFNYRRYRHALHPQTVGVIIETGFLTSPGDRRVILSDPDRAARGIVEAVAAFPDTRQGS